jgi:hypothetical protein
LFFPLHESKQVKRNERERDAFDVSHLDQKLKVLGLTRLLKDFIIGKINSIFVFSMNEFTFGQIPSKMNGFLSQNRFIFG